MCRQRQKVLWNKPYEYINKNYGFNLSWDIKSQNRINNSDFVDHGLAPAAGHRFTLPFTCEKM